MARRRAGAAPGKAAAPGKRAGESPVRLVTVQPSVINLKGTEAYRSWLASVSKKTHIPAAAIVRLALAEWASRNGHPTPPEK